MTNEQGRFILKIPSDSKADSIYLTHVGYKPRTIALNALDPRIASIILDRADDQLAAVTIKIPDALGLVKKAIANIPENYPTTPTMLTGFYRLYGTRDQKIIDLSEAVFKVFSEGFQKNRQFHLEKSRVDKDLTAFNGSDNVNMGWRPGGILGMDIVNNLSGSRLLDEKGLKEHEFNYRGVVNYNGRESYLIGFRKKDHVHKALFDGHIYLDAESFAFLEFDMRASPDALRYWDWGFWQKMMFSLMHLEAKVLSDSVTIIYRPYGNKYFLDHVSLRASYYLAGGNKHFLLNPLDIKTNYLVTRIDTSNISPFPKEQEQTEARRRIESFGKTVNETTDAADNSDTTDRYWADYNLLQAEFNVDSAIRVIQANNATLNLKSQLQPFLRKYKKDRLARIDTILNFYHAKDQFNGAALIQYEGKIIYEKGFGPADIALGKPNTPETQFRIGSTSKQFTAMLIMQLVNEGRLSVTDSAGKFLPRYNNGRVTIEQLLTHQSGIPNYTDNQDYVAQIMEHKYSPDSLVYKFCSDSLDFEPGKKFSYTNSGFVVLADIIEKITGKKYAEVLVERIFKPLGMTSSYFVAGGDSSRLARSYQFGTPENPYPVQNVIGAGGITSSPHDLLRWANALTKNTLLPREQMEELCKPRAAWDEWNAYYGYGFMIDRHIFAVSSAKHVIIYHPGIEFGFHDILVREPDKDIVVILMSNMGDFPRFDMTDLILNELN
jgi:CubicO group peptidase (beta-lactamase class C family)